MTIMKHYYPNVDSTFSSLTYEISHVAKAPAVISSIDLDIASRGLWQTKVLEQGHNYRASPQKSRSFRLAIVEVLFSLFLEPDSTGQRLHERKCLFDRREPEKA